MALTIRNKILSDGERRLALELAGLWTILTSLCAVAVVVGQVDEPAQERNWWVAGTIVCVFACICAVMLVIGFLCTARQLVRISSSAVGVASFRRRRSCRIKVRWSEVQQCLLTKQRLGIATGGERIELYQQFFTKEDWELLRAELEAGLTPYFDLDSPTRYDLRRQRQRAWPIWRKVLDKLAVVGAVVGMFGPLLLGFAVASYFGWTESVPGGVIVCVSALPSIAVLVAISRSRQRQKYERWHDQRVKPAG